MPHRKSVVQDRLETRASQLHVAAEILPHGDEREALRQRAERMEKAALVIGRWTLPGPAPRTKLLE
jgi:hypothetical protein